MKSFAKTALLATATAAMIAAPASARDGRYGRGHDGIDAGDVIAGALVIGGIAAIASAASNGNRYSRNRDYDRYDRTDNGRYGYGYGNGRGDSRGAVDRCVRAAQAQASRQGWARVTDVTRIDRIRGGYEVRGRLVVEGDGYRGRWNGGYDRYGYNYDRYGDGYDKGKFACVVRYGDVQDIRLSGLRGYY